MIGLGIAAMHFTGMQALIVPGRIGWDADLVASAILVGIVFTSAALIAWHEARASRALFLSPALLTLAICGLHFTAMGAVTVLPDPTIAVEPAAMDSSTLAIAVAAVTALVMLTLLAVTLIASWGEHEARLRDQELNARLEQQNKLLRQREARARDAERALRHGARQHAAGPGHVRRRGAPGSGQRALCRALWSRAREGQTRHHPDAADRVPHRQGAVPGADGRQRPGQHARAHRAQACQSADDAVPATAGPCRCRSHPGTVAGGSSRWRTCRSARPSTRASRSRTSC